MIDDTLDLAARPEAEHEPYGTAILVAQDTARAADLDGFDPAGHLTIHSRRAEAIVYTPKQSWS